MKAVAYDRHGGPDVLDVVEAADPRPGRDEAVVEVRAAAVNRLDVLQRAGPPLIPGFSLPHTPGMDIAGDVVEVGDDVAAVSPDDRVIVKAGVHCGDCRACLLGETWRCAEPILIGGNRDGGYAERCVVPASHLSVIPDPVGYVDAAAVPTAFSTAWRALVRTGDVRLGETVVIHAAGSGVSVFAIQLAKLAGATVIATSRSDAKLARAKELGADIGVNSSSDSLADQVRHATGGEGADLVFDHVGPDLFGPSIRSLRPGGRLVICGTTSGVTAEIHLPTVYHSGISILGVQSQTFAEYLHMIDRYWDLGIKPVVDDVLPLDQAGEAHRRLEESTVFGKLVLSI